jgi:phage tail sheath protein FI
VAVLDVPDGLERTELVLAWREQFGSSFGALYHPWVRTADPRAGGLRAVPPSGHVAGVYARGDLLVGVHRPPANELVEAAADVRFRVDDLRHGELNDGGVNVIRAYGGRGLRVGGARTLSEDPPWRYVNVRRLLCMIEATIDRQTQWAVFEPNNRELWRDVDRVIRGFLDRLWRLGALDGATAEEAYSVQCDDTTNPPPETEAGRLTCRLGVLPPWPAEFVVVRIGRTRGETEILEQRRAGDA